VTKMPQESLVTTTPITKEAGLAEETGLSDLRRIVEGLPDAEEILGLMLWKGATEPEDFKRLFAEDEEFRDKTCKSLRQAIKVWVAKKFPQVAEVDLEDIIEKVLVEVLVAVESRYDPTRAPLLSYCQPYFRKAYDEFDRLVTIRDHEQLESAMAEIIPLEDESDEWEIFQLENIPAGLPSPEDEAIEKADLERLAERIGFGSVASLLAALEDTVLLSKVERCRLRRRILKELRAMAWEIRGRRLIAPSAPNDGASAGKISADLKGGRPK
jgi:hypothetical protein